MQEDNRNGKQLDMDEISKVAGGTDGGTNIPAQRFNVGDKVLMRVYSEFGVGTVREAKVVNSKWQYVVQFDSGMITADEFEFIPA